MNENEYEPCSYCGGKVVDDKPSFIQLSEDEILKITDQKCTVCGMSFIGPNQKLETIKNREMVKKLHEFMRQRAMTRKGAADIVEEDKN
jgi:hypothetical protein